MKNRYDTLVPHELTVCICVYNGAEYIEETLQSLWNQTFREFDLLIVNDCSTDNTVEVIRDFLASNRWQYVQIVDLPKNVGLAGARKRAEAMVGTPLLQFIDADDVAASELVEKLYDYLRQRPDCIAVSCYGEYISPDSKKIGGGLFLGPRTPEEFFRQARSEKLLFLPPVTMFRLAVANSVGGRAVEGFPEGRPRYQDMCEDLDLWTRMSDLFVKKQYLVVVPEILFKYRKFATSVSANSRAMNWRIRHIKTNLKRRRSGLPDLTFIDYMATITSRERFLNFFLDKSSDCYKQAGFHFLQKHYFRFLGDLILAGIFSPRYVLQKIRKNIIPALQHK